MMFRKHHFVQNASELFDRVEDHLRRGHSGENRPVLYLPGNAGRIPSLEEWLFEHAERLNGVDVFQVLALGPAEGWQKAVLGGIHIVTPFIGASVRELVNQGLASNIRCNLSQVPRLFRGRWRPNVAIAHVSMPNALGQVTLGLNAGVDYSAVRNAQFKVAVINKQMPRFHIYPYYDQPTGKHIEVGCPMYLSDFDLVLETDEPLTELPMSSGKKAPSSAMDAIAEHILDYLSQDMKKGETVLPHTLQLGIGKIPDAFARGLAKREQRVNAVWSEIISDGTYDLYRSQLIHSVDGSFLREHIVVGLILGSKELYDSMHENPHYAVLPQEIINDPSMIRHNPWMVSINTALAVSVTGEVAASTIQKKYYSDVGGQFDFAQGASQSEHGVAIIALESVAKLRSGATESKVVVTHSDGAHYTIGADLPVVVVTEHGVADLRMLDDPERVEEMIKVAHPDWRTTLAKEARTLPSMQGVGVIPSRLLRLADGRVAILRPVTTRDIPAIGAYIEKLDGSDRNTRYMSTVSISALTSKERLMRVYHDTLDYLTHAAFILELNGEIIGVTHAYRESREEDSFELSFSRRSDLRGLEIGRNLMRIIIDWGIAAGVKRFHAITYRTENPRMRRLFDRFGFTATPDPDERAVVRYAANVADLAERQMD